jgi:hypothetical protein
MFDAFREYTAANPRREQLRRENRHLLKTVREAHHPRLSLAAPNLHWDCLGDLALLDYPVLLPIVVSRRATEAEKDAQLADWIERVARGAIPIGGFISPGEKAALKAFATMPRTRVIRLLPFGLKDFRPHGRQLENLALSRLLILSAFPEEVEGCNWDNCHWTMELPPRLRRQLRADNRRFGAPDVSGKKLRHYASLSARIASMRASSSSVKAGPSMAVRFSSNCSGRLAPTMTDVTSGRRSSHDRAMAASDWRRSRVKALSLATRPSKSGVRLSARKKRLRAARLSAGTPFR